jgi:hypothetical protein
MKKVFFLLFILTGVTFGQNFYDSPSRAVMDTLGTVSYITRDFYFNPANTNTGVIWNNGTSELKVVSTTYSVIQTVDTLTVDAWGITLIKHKKPFWAKNETVSYYTDSTRIGTVPVTADTSLKNFAFDQIFSTFYTYDGVRVKYKLGGSDADSVKIWSVVRLYIPSKD